MLRLHIESAIYLRWWCIKSIIPLFARTQALDTDDSKTLSFQELQSGLRKLNFK